MELYEMYQPQIATPFTYNYAYIEIPPCKELLPYVKCFWGSPKPYIEHWRDISAGGLIIPDTCMDIIFDINYSNNTINSWFAGLDDTPLCIKAPDFKCFKESMVSTFGIRFYAWGTVMFSEESMNHTKGNLVGAEYFFSKIKSDLERFLFEVDDIYDRVRLAQQYLLKSICLKHYNETIFKAIYEMLRNNGGMKIAQLAKEIHLSERQLQRVFDEYIGISPKKLSSLFRYQYLWREILYNKEFNIAEQVYRLGYADQAHLLNDFKKFHTMTPKGARLFAFKDVGFFQ